MSETARETASRIIAENLAFAGFQSARQLSLAITTALDERDREMERLKAACSKEFASVQELSDQVARLKAERLGADARLELTRLRAENERLQREVNKVNDFRERKLIKQRETVEHISQLRVRVTLKELLREAARLVRRATNTSGGEFAAFLARPEIAALKDEKAECAVTPARQISK